jgi:hypothetical protein
VSGPVGLSSARDVAFVLIARRTAAALDHRRPTAGRGSDWAEPPTCRDLPHLTVAVGMTFRVSDRVLGIGILATSVELVANRRSWSPLQVDLANSGHPTRARPVVRVRLTHALAPFW